MASMRNILLVTAMSCATPAEDCARPGVAGIELSVIDVRGGASLNPQARVTVTQLSPPYDSRTGLLGGSPPPLGLAYDRPGEYRILVSVPGYLQWEKNVTVIRERARCGAVITQRVIATVEPSP